MDSVLRVNDIGISFGQHHVLKSVNFELGKQEILGVIGPNGAGKTVMLNILTGILRPTKGQIFLCGENVTQTAITERCRKGFGRTFQVPRPFEKMTVFENIVVGGVYGRRISEKAAKGKALTILDMMGLGDKGEWLAGKLGLLDRKRLEIARAFVSKPKVLLLDEVAGGLTDMEVGNILEIVKRIRASGVSIVWIEHVLKTMAEGTDRVLCLAEGRNVVCGLPDQVLRSKEVHDVYLGAIG